MPKTNNAFMTRAASSACKTRFLRFYFSVWLPVRIALYTTIAIVNISCAVYAWLQQPNEEILWRVFLLCGGIMSLLTPTCCLIILLTARKMCYCSYGLTIAHLYVHPILFVLFEGWLAIAVINSPLGLTDVADLFAGLASVSIFIALLLLVAAIPMNVYFYKRRRLFGPLISMDVLKLTPPCALCGDTTPGNLRQKVRVAEGKPQVTLCESCMKRCTAATGAEQLQILKKLYNI